jgi:hypothetical protein
LSVIIISFLAKYVRTFNKPGFLQSILYVFIRSIP